MIDRLELIGRFELSDYGNFLLSGYCTPYGMYRYNCSFPLAEANNCNIVYQSQNIYHRGEHVNKIIFNPNHTDGWKNVFLGLNRVFKNFGEMLQMSRISRIDYNFDVIVNNCNSHLDFVARRQYHRKLNALKIFGTTSHIETIYIGTGDYMYRIYNKSLESKKNRSEIMPETVRYEVQIRGEKTKKIKLDKIECHSFSELYILSKERLLSKLVHPERYIERNHQIIDEHINQEIIEKNYQNLLTY